MGNRMPDFLDEFASSIGNKKEALKEKILKGTPNPLNENFERYFTSNWIPLDDLDKFSVKPAGSLGMRFTTSAGVLALLWKKKALKAIRLLQSDCQKSCQA
jgi:hypothetical protein